MQAVTAIPSKDWALPMAGAEIRAVARRVAREEAIATDGGVGPDEEVRQRRCLASCASPIGEKRLAGKKCRFGVTFEGPCRQGFIELFDPFESDRYFRVDDEVDDYPGVAGGLFEGRLDQPMTIFCEDVDQDVAIDKTALISVASGP